MPPMPQQPGTLMNGAGFGAGKVGQAGLDGSSRYVRPSSTSLRLVNERPSADKDTGSVWYYGLVAKRSPIYPYHTTFGINVLPGSVLQVYFLDPAYGSFQVSGYSPAPAAGVFHHVAATYRQADPTHVELKTYIDGQLEDGASGQPGQLPERHAGNPRRVQNGSSTRRLARVSICDAANHVEIRHFAVQRASVLPTVSFTSSANVPGGTVF
jgi:hypothetical protein